MLVKLPKEVGKIMGTLQQAGFEAYVVGECISDFMAGKKPFGWDVSTNARLEDMKRLFPEAETLSEKFEVVRFEYIEEVVDKDGDVEGESGIIVDLAAYRAGGKYEQGRLTEANFVTTVADDLARRKTVPQARWCRLQTPLNCLRCHSQCSRALLKGGFFV